MEGNCAWDFLQAGPAAASFEEGARCDSNQLTNFPGKQEFHTSVRVQAIRKLCRKGSKKFGVEQSDENLQQAVNTFIHNAR